MVKKKLFIKPLIFALAVSSLGISQAAYANAAELKIGAWPGSQPTASNIDTLEALQQRNLDYVQTFIDWKTNFDGVRSCADATYANGSIFMITWEPWQYNTVQIKDGAADSYIKKMADDMKAYGKELWLRPLHEANGNWYPWGIGDSKVNTNESYIAAYRHIVDIFRAEGATNVKFVFNVNCSNVGQGASFMGHYPGDAYVDYNSIDGYNWGTTQSWGSTWQSFDQIFSSAYNALKPVNKPIFIAEMSSAEKGGDKAQWITDTYNTIKTFYDKIFSVMWFNENKETNWTINSSEASLAAYIKAIGGSTPTAIVGDINKDGKINALDYAKLKAYLLGSSTETPNMNTWDVNGDGKLNAIDLAIFKKYILGQITAFPR